MQLVPVLSRLRGEKSEDLANTNGFSKDRSWQAVELFDPTATLNCCSINYFSSKHCNQTFSVGTQRDVVER